MIIDFHTHVFPDNLAEKALATLMVNIDNLFTPVNNATVSGLLQTMDAANVDIAVVQPSSPNSRKRKKQMNGPAAFVRTGLSPLVVFIRILTIIKEISISWPV